MLIEMTDTGFHSCRQNVVTQLMSYYHQRANYALNVRGFDLLGDAANLSCIYIYIYAYVAQCYSPGNKRTHALGNPQNGIGISGTSLDQQTNRHSLRQHTAVYIRSKTQFLVHAEITL